MSLSVHPEWFLCSFSGVNVPVVGGHAGITILPLFSQVLNLSVMTSFVMFPSTATQIDLRN
jgi:hypothetical protein